MQSQDTLTGTQVAALHDELLAQATWPGQDAPQGEGLWHWVKTNHLFNCRLWAEEDLARRTTVADAEIAANKRAIDRFNQARNDATERVDELLLIGLGLVDAASARTDSPVSAVAAGARLNSETAGSIVDRMSIMGLKIHAMRQQTLRQDVDQAHRDASQVKLERLLQQWGFENARFDWLVDADMALYCVVIAAVWQTTGFVMAMFLAGGVNPNAFEIAGSKMFRAKDLEGVVALLAAAKAAIQADKQLQDTIALYAMERSERLKAGRKPKKK